MRSKKKFTEPVEGVSKSDIIPPVTETLEQREAYMCQIATAEAERRILAGTASPSILVHYLKIASTQHEKQMEKLSSDAALSKAKANALKAESEDSENYDKVISAIQGYRSSVQDENG